MNEPAYYFGCWQGKGHYMHTPAGEVIWHRDLDPAFAGIDQGFCPDDRSIGAAKLTHITARAVDWTVFAFWDNSVDSRGGSHSTFLFKGTHDFKRCVALAKEHFPRVWERYPFHVYPL